MKTCSTCLKTFPLESFYKQPKGAQGVTGACRSCYADRRRRYAQGSSSDPSEFIRLFVEPGQFEVRQDGTVWQLARARGNAHGRVLRRLPEPRQVKTASGSPALNGSTYYAARAGIGGRWFVVRVHRLVWTYIVGQIPSGVEINHVNGVRSDNRLSNLELVTRRENCIHARDVIGRSTFKLSRELAERVRARSAAGVSRSDLASAFGVSRHAINDVIAGRTWTD
jgi:hypothetical protein